MAEVAKDILQHRMERAGGKVTEKVMERMIFSKVAVALGKAKEKAEKTAKDGHTMQAKAAKTKEAAKAWRIKTVTDAAKKATYRETAQKGAKEE